MTKEGFPGLTGAQVSALLANLNPSRVAQRDTPGARGKKMSYLEAWDVKAKLIALFGFGGFDAEVLNPQIVHFEEFDEPVMNWSNGRPTGPKLDANGNPETKHQFRLTFMATYRLTIHATGAVYSEVAIASQKGADPGEVGDFAIKTAESDALKRCATWLGTQFGLSLYASDDNHIHYEDVVKRVFDQDQARVLDLHRAALAAAAQSPSDAPTPAPEAPGPSGASDAADAAAGAALAQGFSHPQARKK